jgi:hypothetical protein
MSSSAVPGLPASPHPSRTATRALQSVILAAKYGWDGDPSIDLTRDAWCYDKPVLVLRHES